MTKNDPKTDNYRLNNESISSKFCNYLLSTRSGAEMNNSSKIIEVISTVI